MATAVSPLASKVLSAGAIGTAGALLFNALIKFGAEAASVSYAIEGSPPVTMGAVVMSVIIAGLVATAFALALAKNEWADRWFGSLAAFGFLLSLLSPVLLGQDIATIGVLVAHHVVAGALIALPLLKALAPEQLGSGL